MNAFTSKHFSANDFSSIDGLTKILGALQNAADRGEDVRYTALDAAAAIRSCAWSPTARAEAHRIARSLVEVAQ